MIYISIISFRYSSSLTSAISIDVSSRTFRRLFVQWFDSLKRRSYLNEIKSVRSSSIIWRNVWLRLLYYVTLIKLVRLFSKLTHLTTSTMKFSLNIMMKKYYIWLSFILRTCLLLNVMNASELIRTSQDLVEIWSKSDSDLTQIWLSIFSLF